MRTKLLQTFVVSVAAGMVSCSEGGTVTPLPSSSGGADSMPTGGSGPSQTVGGNSAAPNGGSNANPTGGMQSTGGVAPTGGKAATGGVAPTGGKAATGGEAAGGAATGGKAATGGMAATGGEAAGGAATGGKAATGGVAPTGGKAATGGASGGTATGGKAATGGATSVAGASATGGATAVSTSTSADPDCNATMPTSGGSVHTSSSQGGTNPLAWQVWSNGGTPGTVTTYSTPAFSTTWNNSSNYLGRLGFEWGNSGGAYDTHGTITAQFVEKRHSGASSNNSWSYIGLYGWTTNPCVEWYIVEDSIATMPISPYNAGQKGTATIDGESYKLYSNSTNGTGGSRCSGVSSWMQFWSVRQKARQCGTITVTQHFDAWKGASMAMGNLLEVKILVEVGGGSGTIDFPVAILTSTK